MTRLIDADALKKALGITGTKESCQGCAYCGGLLTEICRTSITPSFEHVCYQIDDAPTVDIPEAIPIEWIKEQIQVHRHDGFAWIYEAILEDWRKEHAAD